MNSGPIWQKPLHVVGCPTISVLWNTMAKSKINKVLAHLPSIGPANLRNSLSNIRKWETDEAGPVGSTSKSSRCCTTSPRWGTLTFILIVYTISVKAQLNDQRIKPAANYVIEHRNLLPSSDLSDCSANFKQLNSSLKEHFGERFVVLSCLFNLSLL